MDDILAFMDSLSDRRMQPYQRELCAAAAERIRARPLWAHARPFGKSRLLGMDFATVERRVTAHYAIHDEITVTQERPMPDTPWIEWHGGERPPIPDGVHYGIKFRDGTSTENCLADHASHLRWTHINSDADIVAYRLKDPTAWIENTGVRPVPEGTPVDIFLRGAGERDGTYGWAWGCAEGSYAISHWRLRQAEPAVAQTDTPWIEWRGGECPVPGDTNIEWTLSHDMQRIHGPDTAGGLNWSPGTTVARWRPADPSAWIENTGVRPVPLDQPVDIEWADGSIDYNTAAEAPGFTRHPRSWHRPRGEEDSAVRRWRLHQAESPRIEWSGGTCPVPNGTRVRVWYRSPDHHHNDEGKPYAEGVVDGDNHLSGVYWSNDGMLSDIIAYQVLDGTPHAPAPEPPKDPEPTTGSLLDHLELLGDKHWRILACDELARDCSDGTRHRLRTSLVALATDAGRDYLDTQDPTLRDVFSAIQIYDNNRRSWSASRLRTVTLDGEHDLRVIRQRIFTAANIIRQTNIDAA